MICVSNYASTGMPSGASLERSTHPVPNFLTTRCTIGMSLPLTLYTTISPTLVSSNTFRFHRKSRSPRWKAGSMDPERTTTMGDGESAMTESPFHIMNAVERISPKLISCAAACRGFCSADSILAAGEVWGGLMRKREEAMRAKLINCRYGATRYI
jgi:hypothetical protein